jgi:hypothetical protein
MKPNFLSEQLAHLGTPAQITETLNLLSQTFLESPLADDRDARMDAMELINELKEML